MEKRAWGSKEISVTFGRLWRDAMQGVRCAAVRALQATDNAAARPPESIQMGHLFFYCPLVHCSKPGVAALLKPHKNVVEGRSISVSATSRAS